MLIISALDRLLWDDFELTTSGAGMQQSMSAYVIQYSYDH